MNTKLLIWDWNGTILNDVEYCVSVMNGILRKYHLEEINSDYYRKIFTFPVKKYYENLGFDFSKSSFEKVGFEFIEEYNKSIDFCSLYEKIKETLVKIKELGIKQSIISAREHNSLIKDVTNKGIYDLFESVQGISDNYASSKLYLFKEKIKNSVFKLDEILIIGDTIHDCEIAKELGIRFIHFSLGHQDKSYFNDCENIESINDFSRLIDII